MGEGERSEEGITGKINSMILIFFLWKVKTRLLHQQQVPRKAAWIAMALREDCAAPGEFCGAEQ